MHNAFLKNLNLSNNDVVAIDGKCGSGKTTLALKISEIFDVDIIHLDHFFLPLELRTEQRALEVGGNIHYERFKNEVIDGILSKKSFSYKIFDCSIMDYTKTILISNKKPIIIEGAYSLRPDFRHIYTKTVFLDIDFKEQQERIIKRNGSDGFLNFKNKWIPLENAYFDKFDIRSYSDIILK